MIDIAKIEHQRKKKECMNYRNYTKKQLNLLSDGMYLILFILLLTKKSIIYSLCLFVKNMYKIFAVAPK